MDKIQIAIPNLNYRKIFWILAAFLGILMPILSFDYGLIEDAPIHDGHGKIILNYFAGKDSLASLSPFNQKGGLILDTEDKRGLNFFGGFPDLLSTFIHKFFSFVGEYEFRNLMNSLWGFLLFLFTGLLAKELGGWKTGLLALIFIALTPLLFGHSMNNPKDIPFAAFYIFSLFHIVKLLKELPEVKLKRMIFLVINISLLINIRAFGISMLAFLFIAVFAWWIIQIYKSHFKNIFFKNSSILALQILCVGFAAYLAASIFWPYAQTNPLKVPLYVFLKIKDFNLFHTTQLFEGDWVDNFNLPWYFVPKWLIITIPLHILIGGFLIIFLYLMKILRYNVNTNLFLITFTLLVSLFPIIFVVLYGSTSYDNCRHFLFTLPPLISVCALSWDFLAGLMQKKAAKYAIYFVLAILLFQPFRFMITNHPLETLYFSPIIGGPNGAFRNYEMDYWGVAVKPAVKWIEKNAENANPEKPARVRLWYGCDLKASYYVNKVPYLKFVMAEANSADWDYSIVMGAEAKHYHDLLLKYWPPANTVYQVKVDTVTVCAVVRNTIKSTNESIASMESAVAANPSAAGYIQLSLLYYNTANYLKCVDASIKALVLDPSNYVVYNNMCAAYNCLFMFDEAKLSGEKALQLYPNFELAKNNLKETEKGIIKRKERKLSSEQYLNLSYNYYLLGNYEASIKVCKELLITDPTNAIAYNNICSAYNAIGNYKEARKACEQALKFKPDFDLAKNNLKVAEKEINNLK